MKKKHKIIARWIYLESPDPIAEIEWLLKEKYNSNEKKLLSDYDDVLINKKVV